MRSEPIKRSGRWRRNFSLAEVEVVVLMWGDGHGGDAFFLFSFFFVVVEVLGVVS